MKSSFRLEESKLKQAHNSLLRQLFVYLSTEYELGESPQDFVIQEISIGISRSDKLFVNSKNSYPYFVKVGDAKNIKRENSKYGQAARKIPALSIPPREIFIEDTETNCALVAFRYVTGVQKTDSPNSLFYQYAKMDTFSLMALIDDLFQVVMRDFHSFRTAKYDYHEITKMTEEIFSPLNDPRITRIVSCYNSLVGSMIPLEAPIGYIHGDLHAENILVGRYNNPIILDFEMSLRENCLVRDYAEFEIALLFAAASNSFDEVEQGIIRLYSNRFIFGVNGVSKHSSAVTRIRSNLYEELLEFSEQRNINPRVLFKNASMIYRFYLLRYICFYSRIAYMNQRGAARHGTISLFCDVFEKIKHSIHGINGDNDK